LQLKDPLPEDELVKLLGETATLEGIEGNLEKLKGSMRLSCYFPDPLALDMVHLLVKVPPPGGEYYALHLPARLNTGS